MRKPLFFVVCVAVALCALNGRLTKAGNAVQRMLDVPNQDPYTEQVDQIIASLTQARTILSPEEARLLPIEDLFEKHLRAAQRTRAGSAVTARLSSGNAEGDGGRLFTRLTARMDAIARNQMYEPITRRFVHYTQVGSNPEVAKASILEDIGSYQVHLDRLQDDAWNTANRLNQLMRVRSSGQAEDMTEDLARHLIHTQVPLHEADFVRLYGIVDSLIDKAKSESEALEAAAQATSSSSARTIEHMP